ncbi:MAG: homing endonuclease associated repeat-containing protein [Candidatus Nanohaloarchaea archaeon]
MTGGLYTDDELIGFLREHATEDWAPTVQYFNSRSDLPSADTYKRRYGDWNNALWRAGLKPNEEQYGREEMIDQFIRKGQELGMRPPTWRDIDDDKTMPALSSYRERFSYEELVEETGFVTLDDDNSRWIDEREVYAAWEEAKDSEAVAKRFGITADRVQEAVAAQAF